MLKCLTILAVLLAVPTIPAQTSHQSSQASSEPITGHTTDQPCYWHKAFAPEFASNWALVLVGIGAGVLAFFTLRKIRDQAESGKDAAIAGKDAARAALLNAQAVINAERAWLAVSIDIEVSNPNDPNETPKCYVAYLNQGRTPAKIIGIDFTHRFIDQPDNLPVPPTYNSPSFLPDSTFIVSRDSFKINPFFDPISILTQARKQVAVGFSTEFLMFYGRITYEDVFANQEGEHVLHETRWCFAYNPNSQKRFVACGPNEYNQHT